ncbi:hypothetical protein Snoj_82880 [Streptomyces nojiriensis]|uniref:Holin n=1 Tax=Streptomyces nojiriensis TaxID=66374 RepID=A0ABQ3T2Y4_9ACTN|nr:hypothetical protein GCM10010205_51380 [Streptomyces nojiriensis]GHI74370.1 hypothetical protein Snoj_82880 [Streptomyces nojiriensis]
MSAVAEPLLPVHWKETLVSDPEAELRKDHAVPSIFDVTFWKATTERVIRTFAQALAATLIAGGASLLSVPWPAALGTAGMAAVLALLTAVAAGPIGPPGPGVTEEAVRNQ